MSQRDEFVQIVKRMPKEEAKFFLRFLRLLIYDPEFKAELDRLIPKNAEITEREWRIAVDLVEKWEQRKKTDSSETGGKCCENMLVTDIQPPSRETLVTARECLGVSKSELCRQLDIRPKTYSGYLLGDRVPPLVLNRLDILLQEQNAGHILRG